jgi:hypothetical protein
MGCGKGTLATFESVEPLDAQLLDAALATFESVEPLDAQLLGAAREEAGLRSRAFRSWSERC